MPRKYTDSNFVIQTTANISSQWSKASNIDQIPFSLTPFTVKSATSLKVCPSAPFGTKAYIAAQRLNPRDFLFETEKLNWAYRSATATTVTPGDHVIGITGHGVAVILPLAASLQAGTVFTIKDTFGNTTGANVITIGGIGGNLIDGVVSIVLNSKYASVNLITDGASKWYII